jgi:hypothetical protein
MAIQNEIGIVSYPRRMARGLEGQPAESELPLGDTYRVPLLAQVNTVEIGGFGADADQVIVDITLPDGTVVSTTTTRAAGVPVDDAAAAAALALAINANATLNTHVDASSALAFLTLTFKHPNVVYTVATRVTAATAAVVQTQAPGGTAATPGRFVTSGAEVGGIPAIAALGAASTEFDIRGIVLREQTQGPNAGSALAGAVDQVQPGNLVAVAYRNKVLMRNNGSVAAARGGEVFVVRSTAGGQEIGQARADDDVAGDAQVSTGTPTAVDDTQYSFEIVFRGETHVISFLAGAGTSATLIADGLRADLLTHDELDGLIVGTGTATLILTGPPDEAFTVNNTGPGVIAFAATTAPTSNAIPISRSRAQWAEAVPVGAIGALMLNIA